MSSDTFVAYFGLKFEVNADEIEAIELRSDPRIATARRAGLKYYFGNFAGLQENNLMFVGAQLGILGPENSRFIDIELGQLQQLIDKTKTALVDAGFEGTPSLHLQWQPDI
jgi:hypothetical protein